MYYRKPYKFWGQSGCVVVKFIDYLYFVHSMRDRSLTVKYFQVSCNDKNFTLNL